MEDLIFIATIIIAQMGIFTLMLQNSIDKYKKKETEFIQGLLTTKQKNLIDCHKQGIEEERQKRQQRPFSFAFEEICEFLK